MKFFKILDKANRIVLILGAYIPSVTMTLDKAVQILNDYKSQLLNINQVVDEAALESENPDDYVSSPVGTVTDANNVGTAPFPEYKGFKFALKEEENPKFVVRGYKRRYAVAINKAGVEVLKSEFSFTLDPNDLIEQLKLLIDQQNLSATSNNSFGSIGGGGGTNGRTTGNIPSSQFQLQTPSADRIAAAKRAVDTQPPQPRNVTGPTKTITEEIPLSVQKKAKLVALTSSPLSNFQIDAAFILKEDRQWQADFKRYRNNTSSDVLRIEP